MKFTILIADDDRRLPGRLKRLLTSRRRVSVVEARDGEEALRLALELRPDIVLMDIVMPNMDGLDAARRIKAVRPEIKIIMLTVHDEAQYRTAARDSGADRYLLKKRLGVELIPAIGSLVPEFPATDPVPPANGRTSELFGQWP